MADNLTTTTTVSTVANGTIIATDQIPGTLEQYQKIKLADGTADSTAMIPGDATNGLFVNVKAMAALPSGSNVIGTVGVLGLKDSGATDMTDTTNHALKVSPVTAIQTTNLMPSSGLTLNRVAKWITSATTTALVADATGVVKVYGLVVVNGAAAQNLTFQDTAGTNVLVSSGAMQFAINGGIVLPKEADQWFNDTASGKGLSVVSSSTGNTLVVVYYTQG